MGHLRVTSGPLMSHKWVTYESQVGHLRVRRVVYEAEMDALRRGSGRFMKSEPPAFVSRVRPAGAPPYPVLNAK